MPSQNDNGGRRGPWGGGAKPGSDFEDLVRQGQDRLGQIMPTGGPRSAIVLVILALAALVAWTTYYTVPSDSVAVAANLIVALTLVAIGGRGVVYFYFIDTSWPRGMTVAAGIVGAAGLYWLWDAQVLLDATVASQEVRDK